MKQVVTAYGRFLLEGMVFVLLVTMVFTGIEDNEGNKGVLAMIGSQLELENTDYHAYTDFRETYQTESKKAAPVIIYSGRHLKIGKSKLTDYISAVDYAGNEIHITIKEIKDSNGLELIDSYNIATSEMIFKESGIYTVTVCATDDICQSSECRIQIPVNR